MEGGRQLLKIELEHSVRLEIFDIAVDLPTVQANPSFGAAFSSLEEFREGIEANFSSLQATEQGSIIFRLPFYKTYISMELPAIKREFAPA